jgi:hypothetical protein
MQTLFGKKDVAMDLLNRIFAIDSDAGNGEAVDDAAKYQESEALNQARILRIESKGWSMDSVAIYSDSDVSNWSSRRCSEESSADEDAA